jgi:quinol-cytochrome oxidoreductase complex cytochrome b subunit
MKLFSRLAKFTGFPLLPNQHLSPSLRGYVATFSKTPAASPAAALLVNHGPSYPAPLNLSYFWTFGSLSALCLGLQLLSGIFLAMHYLALHYLALHYTAALSLAFDSVEHIMRDVSGGWFIRYLHANGASAFFGVVYLHMFRGLLYQSYRHPNRGVWLSGVALFGLMMATAFIGYVLPWGQMSFWGATVITNLFSVIPLVGPSLVQWLWGGFAVGGATLSRFYSLHYLLPFLLVALALLHIFALHQQGSSNPLGGESRDVATYVLPLYPYFLVKDLLGALIFAAVLGGFIFYAPNLLGHSDNYIEANSLVTPEHIVPE